MRDIILSVILIGLLFPSIRWPWFGALAFAWISLMSPHRSTWGFAYAMPWAQMFALVTIAGVFWAKEKDFGGAIRFYWIMLLYVVWISITTYFALEHASAMVRYIEVIKIQLMVFLTMVLVTRREHLWALVWVIALSIGYYGVKGGLFTIATGGNFRVWGPPGTAIEDNNHLAVAVLIVSPLLYVLSTRVQKRWMSLGLKLSALICVAGALGSHSRTAFLATLAMAGFFALKSKHKILIGIATVVLLVTALPFMPQHWWDRMNSIQSYQQDASAMGRLNTWQTAVNVANDRVTGAGFEYYGPRVFRRYAPNPEDVHSAHSLYFQAIGEQGWIGLVIYLSFWAMVWFRCGALIRKMRGDPLWQSETLLMRMVHVAMVPFLVGGMFLNIGNWDGAFYIAALVLMTERVYRNRDQKAPVAVQAAPRPANIFATNPALRQS